MQQIQRRPIKMRFFHQNENCRISAILGLRKKFFLTKVSYFWIKITSFLLPKNLNPPNPSYSMI